MSTDLDILKLRSPIRKYAWGSREKLAHWMGRPDASEPEAELWMGAHPRAPSEAFVGGRWVTLLELIETRTEEILGRRVTERWGGRLPFLFKVLAVEEPLSIQAHPDAIQAAAGFARENTSGIAVDALHRAYPDPNHKPELVCALTPFTALKGFRNVSEVRTLLARVLADEFSETLQGEERSALRMLLDRLLSMDEGPAREFVSRVRAEAERLLPEAPFAWVVRLARRHPSDPMILAPLFLNLVSLAPHESLYLPAGELHCYLEGMALEIMANSDNVLRGGLTQKPVHRQELAQVLRFESSLVEVLRPLVGAEGISTYAAPVEEFSLSRVDLLPGSQVRIGPVDSAEILLCVEGCCDVGSSGQTIQIRKSESVVVAYSATRYELSGAGVVYRAAISR